MYLCTEHAFLSPGKSRGLASSLRVSGSEVWTLVTFGQAIETTDLVRFTIARFVEYWTKQVRFACDLKCKIVKDKYPQVGTTSTTEVWSSFPLISRRVHVWFYDNGKRLAHDASTAISLLSVPVD